MSKLDDILYKFRGSSPMSDTQWDEVSKGVASDLKDLMLELIGEDYEPEMHDVETGEYRTTKQMDRNRIGAFQNKLRAELRKKVAEL